MIRKLVREMVEGLTGEPEPPKDAYWATRIMLREMIVDCPVCKKSLDGHKWATLAEAGNDTDIQSLLHLLSAEDWENLNKIQSFVGTQNAVIAIAIQCPLASGATLAYVDYYEPFWSSERGECRILDELQWQGLIAALPAIDWRPF